MEHWQDGAAGSADGWCSDSPMPAAGKAGRGSALLRWLQQLAGLACGVCGARTAADCVAALHKQFWPSPQHDMPPQHELVNPCSLRWLTAALESIPALSRQARVTGNPFTVLIAPESHGDLADAPSVIVVQPSGEIKSGDTNNHGQECGNSRERPPAGAGVVAEGRAGTGSEQGRSDRSGAGHTNTSPGRCAKVCAE